MATCGNDQWLVTIECNSALLATSHPTVVSGEWLVVSGEWLVEDPYGLLDRPLASWRPAAQEITIPMVNPGGESTMLGHWRIVLRQAEEAARAGRFEEAYALANRPDVADHHHAVQFRSRLALDLIARATRRGAVDDLAGAIEDLNLAERIGAPPDSLAAARLNLADRVADEVRVDLDAGEPVRVLGADRRAGTAQDRRSVVAADPRDRRGLAVGAGRRAARRVWPGAGTA